MKFQLIHHSPLEKEIIGLFKTDLTMLEIAEKLGIGKTTLGNMVKKLSLKRSPRFKYKGYDKKKIESLERLGLSHMDIAKKLGVHITTLKRIYNHLNAPVVKKCDNVIRLKQAFEEGNSLKQIAIDLNCSEKSVSNKIKDLKWKRPRNSVQKESPLNNQEDLIKALYAQGLSGSEIAEQVHTHPISVYNKIRKMKLTRPQKWAEYRSKFSVYDDELLNLYHSGLTYKQIGEKFNIPLTTVAYRIKRLEVSNA